MTTSPQQAAPQPRKAASIFYVTDHKENLLTNLAEFGCLLVKDLVELNYDRWTKSRDVGVNNTLDRLERDKLVNKVQYKPKERIIGNPPDLYGLSEKGVDYAQQHFPWTDPKLFSNTRSSLFLVHDLKAARAHIKIANLCDAKGWNLYWQKTDLKHIVDPDQAFIIEDPNLQQEDKRARFFLEIENEAKNFKALREKFQRYEDGYHSPRFKELWPKHFPFRVVTQVATAERCLNMIEDLAGVCRCTKKWNDKIIHTCNKKPLLKEKLWFTTDDLIMSDPGGSIFTTPKDYSNEIITDTQNLIRQGVPPDEATKYATIAARTNTPTRSFNDAFNRHE